MQGKEFFAVEEFYTIARTISYVVVKSGVALYFVLQFLLPVACECPCGTTMVVENITALWMTNILANQLSRQT